MDFLIVTTQSHNEMCNRFFRATLPAECGAVILEKRLDLAGEGKYESNSWQTGVTAKLRWALEYVGMQPADTVFVLSDVDIQFFEGFSTVKLEQLLLESGADILFQKEGSSSVSIEVNTGFYIARNTVWLRNLLTRAVQLCEEAEVKNDQTAINSILDPDQLGKQWGFLPSAYYARSHGFPPPSQIVLHHANLSGSVPEKIGQLNRVRRYVTGTRPQRLGAAIQEAASFARSGKLTAVVRMRLKGR